ncbi:MAG: sialidase family protein [Candidatus Hydrogenedentota bacterium]
MCVKSKLRDSLNIGGWARLTVIAAMTLGVILWSANAGAGMDEPVTALGKPAESSLDVFLGEPRFEKRVIFEEGDHVREPYLAVALDGTVLAVRNQEGHMRRSEDGGESWSGILEVPIGFRDTNMIVDETTGDILSVRMWDGEDTLWRSTDHGKSWTEEDIVLKPNEVMKWLERTGLKERSAAEEGATESQTYFMHGNASESGITLRHGKHEGRLLVSATFRPHAEAHPSDRDPVDAIYSCAIHSDDGGATWQVSGFFPEGYTEEAALAELSDGRIHYNSRSHQGYHASDLERELTPEDRLRRIAWSDDGGRTWEDREVSSVLPDGGGYDRGYGMKGGLVRLPVKDRDILIYSNADTEGGPRERMTVWASFDGGETWPVKRLVFAEHAAYSSLGAGRPDTPSEGQIYLLFEGSEAHRYHAMQVARFNLSWLLEGEPTGDGEIPAWVSE